MTFRANKYGVAPKAARTVDGITFASKGEMLRWLDLRNLERAGKISGLSRQPRFLITVQGENICAYVADFQYVEHQPDGKSERIVEDFKGMRTEAYRLKAKLVRAVYGITIRETSAR